ncbi:hypothetical protein [Arhodomonas sp. AD133]|uniref:hypothetical protein n=1 Tax=Arhodomonas sp. AD133 TaxID=3415009 RepID=UPI003EBD3CBB
MQPNERFREMPEYPGYLVGADGSMVRAIRGEVWKHLPMPDYSRRVDPPRRFPPDHNVGSKHGMAKIDEDTAAEIKRCLGGGESGASISRRFGVSPSTVSRIRRGEGWKHVRPVAVAELGEVA